MTLKTNKIFPRDGKPAGATAGGIVQIVYAEENTIKSWSFTNTGADDPQTTMEASITPTSASNKVLVMCKGTAGVNAESTTNEISWFLSRTVGVTTTRIGGNTQSSHFKGTKVHASAMQSSEAPTTSSFQYMDSPGTTSAVTYKLGLLGGESATYYINRGDSSSSGHFCNSGNCTITLMECSA